MRGAPAARSPVTRRSLTVPSQDRSSRHAIRKTEIASAFARLRAEPHGGLCVQVGCQDVASTLVLADLFDHVLAVDSSTAVLQTGQDAVRRAGVVNVDFQLVSEDRLDEVADEIADAVVECGFLERLHRKAQLFQQLGEFGRVLRRSGHVYVTVPLAARGPKRLLQPPGVLAISERRLGRALSQAHLTVCASDETASAGRLTRELLLDLARD